MGRKIYKLNENSVILEQLNWILGLASKEKENEPESEIFLSFDISMKNSVSFFKKILIYAYENRLGIIIDGDVYLPDGGDLTLSKENFQILLDEKFN